MSSKRVSTNEKLRRRRTKLWDENDGKCYWCGCDTILPPQVPYRRVRPDNEATIDHLRPRFYENRADPSGPQEERTVLACNKCNFERNREEELKLGVDGLKEYAEKKHKERQKRKEKES